MKTRVIALSALAGLASVASAQAPSFTYSIQAPASLAAGATAQITVLCAFTPGVGQNVTTSLGALPVMGLESGGFSIVGSGGSWSGLSLLAPVNFPFGTTVGTVAGGNVTGAIWGTGFVPPAVPSTVNPTPIWRGTFTMPNANVTLTLTGNGQGGLWAGPHSSGLAVVANGAQAGAQATILVPAPASLALLGLGGLVAARRRR